MNKLKEQMKLKRVQYYLTIILDSLLVFCFLAWLVYIKYIFSSQYSIKDLFFKFNNHGHQFVSPVYIVIKLVWL